MPSKTKLLKFVLTAALAAAAWFALAPTALGGYDSYVITDGTSMLPTIHGGGVIVTRSEPSYHVGEIVAYHNAQLKDLVVLHRIIAKKNGHYTFKGDNNPYPDSDSPTKSALVGRKWLYWAGGGRFAQNIRTPIVGAILLGAVGIWAFWDLGSPTKKPNRHRRGRHRTA